jgi:hypothetical protein
MEATEGVTGEAELRYLTDELRKQATQELPTDVYRVMTRDNIFAMLPPDKNAAECFEGQCLVEIGRNVGADFAVQGTVSKFGGMLTLTVEAYETLSANLISSFTAESPDAKGLLAAIRKDAPEMFLKVQGKSAPGAVGGIIFQSGGKATNETYTVKINTNPEGAMLLLDGSPESQCAQTPCAFSLRGGQHQLIVSKELYAPLSALVNLESDTVFSLTLPPRYGTLNLAPSFVDGMGKDKPWQVTVGDRSAQMGELRLAPNNYQVKLMHPCYQDISFQARINNGETYTFDQQPVPRTGGLDLDANATASEPVWINGVQAGETPFIKTVPICATVAIGAAQVPVAANLVEGKMVSVTSGFLEAKVTEEQKRAAEARLAAFEADKKAESESKGKTYYKYAILFAPVFSCSQMDATPACNTNFWKENTVMNYGAQLAYSFYFNWWLGIDARGGFWAGHKDYEEKESKKTLWRDFMQEYRLGVVVAKYLSLGVNYSIYEYGQDFIDHAKIQGHLVRSDRASGFGFYAALTTGTIDGPGNSQYQVGAVSVGYALHPMKFKETATHKARNVVSHEIFIQSNIGLGFGRTK